MITVALANSDRTVCWMSSSERTHDRSSGHTCGYRRVRRAAQLQTHYPNTRTSDLVDVAGCFVQVHDPRLPKQRACEAVPHARHAHGHAHRHARTTSEPAPPLPPPLLPGRIQDLPQQLALADAEILAVLSNGKLHAIGERFHRRLHVSALQRLCRMVVTGHASVSE